MPALTHPGPSRRGPARRRPHTLLALVVALVAGLVATATSAAAFPGAPWFMPYFDASSPFEQQRRGAEYHPANQYYTHNFPDPDVLRDGNTFYAYGTSTGGAYLPVMTSTDLVNWAPRRPYDKSELDPALVPAGGQWMYGDEWFNDALLKPPSWGGDFADGRMSKELWAPGVEKFGETYVAFYAVRLPLSRSPERYCLSFAVADSPIGPFYDTSSTWLHCDSDPKGSIDPEPFIDDDGTPYLLWKSEGRVNVHGPRVYVQELAGDGQSFAVDSSPTQLMTQDQSWEGDVVENPSMIRQDGQLYLFYSGNEWNSGSYATGYAVCSSVTGPCTKARTTPLMAGSAALEKYGAGGASAFHDADGALRLAYHYWSESAYTGYPADQRRMAVTEVSGSGKRLAVGPDAPAGPAPAPAPEPDPDGPPIVLTPDEACPAGVVPANAFADDDGNAHETAIDCVKWWSVTAGRDGRYDPLGGVTRAQMATFLANALDGSGGDLADSPVDFFADDNGTPHERNINRLASVGVVSGKAPGAYAPGDLVTRAQMATFLVRAVKQRTGEVLVSARDYFGDDEGAGGHEANINAAAAAGLASGTSATSYTPSATVRRDQMASFLARVLEFYVERGAPLPHS